MGCDPPVPPTLPPPDDVLGRVLALAVSRLGRAEGRPADFVIAASHLLFLLGTGGVLRKHGANDSGGMLDAALFGVCTVGPIWAWLIAPRLTPSATPIGEMLEIADIAVLAAVLACLMRISTRVSRAGCSIAYLMFCCLATLGGHVSAVLTASNGSSTWGAVRPPVSV